MGFIRLLLRLPMLLILLLAGIVMVYVYLPRDPQRLKNRHWLGIRYLHRSLLFCLGVKLKHYPCHSDELHLYLGNHISWLDISVIGSVLDTCFVAKAEIRDWPIIGEVSHRGGSIFISRGKKSAASNTIDAINNRLSIGQSVLIFPEGTTSNGETVRHFHARLIAAACQSGVAVQPLAISYPNCPEAAYIDDDHLLTHLLQIMMLPKVDVELSQLPSIDSSRHERKIIAQQAHAAVSQVLKTTT